LWDSYQPKKLISSEAEQLCSKRLCKIRSRGEYCAKVAPIFIG
jgi:hypothetical protein